MVGGLLFNLPVYAEMFRGDVRRDHVDAYEWIRANSPADAGILSGEHGGLPASVGMATEKDPRGRILRLDPSKRIHCIAQPFAVLCAVHVRGRAVRALLPVGEVAAKHGKSGVNEHAGQCYKQRRLAVRARAVREHQGTTAGCGGTVQKTAHGRRGIILKRSCVNVGKQAGTPLGQ